ncbi:MAG: 50S ribosomal protein L25 [Actinomycetota bacterium]
MEITLEVDPRTETGKGPARRARARGLVPAVFYGPTVEPVSLLVDAKAMTQALHTEAGANVLINLKFDGDDFLTVPREIQKHPIRGDVLHVDFVRVARDVKISAHVPLHLEGEAAGVKQGGQLDQYLYELEVEALPTDVPPYVVVDVSEFEMDDSMKSGEIKLPAGVELVSPDDELVLAVNEPTVMKVEAEAEEGEAEEGEEGEAEEGEEPKAKSEEAKAPSED